MSSAALFGASTALPPWTVERMREFFRAAQVHRFFAHCLGDRGLFVDLQSQGLGTTSAVVIEGQPCAVFQMSDEWVLELKREFPRVAPGGAA